MTSYFVTIAHGADRCIDSTWVVEASARTRASALTREFKRSGLSIWNAERPYATGWYAWVSETSAEDAKLTLDAVGTPTNQGGVETTEGE